MLTRPLATGGYMTELPDDLISPKKAAAILGVNTRTVWRWCAAGKVRSWKVRQLVRVSEGDIRAMVEERPADVDAALMGRRAARARQRHTLDVLRKAKLLT